MISRSSQFYTVLGIALFFGTFGFNGLFVFLICILCFVCGFCYVIYTRGEEKSKELASDFTNLKDFKFPPGVEMFLKNKNRFNDKSIYEQIHSMTNCQSMDAVLEQLEMEKTICRDLLCTTPHYENAYLHDVVDIVLYLIMPPEDFRCRPLRFLLREIIGVFVKQQLSSLDFVDGLIRKRLVLLTNNTVDSGGLDVAITRVPLDESIISKFLTRIESDDPCDYWFEQIQEKVVEILRTDEHFYPGFKKSPLYPKMLADLGITGDEDRPETPASDTGSAYSVLSDQEQRPLVKEIIEEGMINDGKPVTTAVVETLGIGLQGRQSFALYNVRVSRSVNGKKVSSWNVLRRYSDFHTLHAFIVQKVMSAMFDPIKMSVKAVGNTVLSVPDQVYGGVSKVGAGINNAAKVIIQPLNGGPRAPVIDTDRVAAAITDDLMEVALQCLNAQVTVLRQFVTPFGTSINKRIVDLVHWLTSEQQVTMYLTALRDSVWPDGQLAGESPPRSIESRARARILAKSLMLSALPDELRLILGADTTYTGINTISNALQNKQLNRRLLYVLLERLLITIFPNNRLDKIFARLHSKSPRSKRS
ncbi:sorting nexin [Teladorsagia circumcincta]|uniref:Sorting nexin n=1 Tax=Teladorsagia circumcincta TaxID=45464 RepID=A0A2G9U8I7_TELCI|nr:sorting nexin [Teladorsagia circumcincta]